MPNELDPVREVVFGAVAGMVGKLVEHPFDTVKVRVQTAGDALTWSMITDTWRNEGIVHGFYLGIRAPIVGACLENAILFLSYNAAEVFLDKFVVKRTLGLQPMPFWTKIALGAFAGFLALFVLTPVELVKCQLQVLNLTGKRESYGLLIGSIVRQNGIQGLWHGLLSTITREVIGTAIWFGSYEYCTAKLQERQVSPLTASLISGGVAGALFNSLVFPVDTIKLNIQTYEVLHGQRVGAAFVARKLAQRGIGAFYQGLGITLVRAVPANALIFYTYELLKRHFGPLVLGKPSALDI
ncbi:MC/SLC25 family protein [Kocuria palustris]|nr:MC/SLC25 family protein [Kocuria palustris]